MCFTRKQGNAKMECTVLLNMATTFIEHTRDPRKIAAQENVLQSYRRLRKPGGVQVFLFTVSNSAWTRKARASNVIVVNHFAVNKHGTPKVSTIAIDPLLDTVLTVCAYTGSQHVCNNTGN